MKKFLHIDDISIDNIIFGAVVLLVLICIILLSAPAIGVKGESTTYSCAQITFGYSKKLAYGTRDIFGFSFGYFITYIFVIAGMVCSIISFINKKNYGVLVFIICGLVAFGCFLFAGVFFFQAVPYCNIPGGNSSAVETIRATYTLGGGAITSGIFSLICSGLMAIFTVKGIVEN